MKTIIVVPTYNEAENVEPLLSRIAETVPGVHLLIADDNSPDGTADKAEKYAADHGLSDFRVYRRTGPRGFGRSYVDAFTKTVAEGYDRVIQMDADLSHDPSYLPAMIAASESADLVIGSRYCPGGGVRNWPFKRVALSRWANFYVHTITGVPAADATAGFRCWTRKALEAVKLDTITADGYSFQVEMLYRAHRAGMKVVEVPIIFTDRQYGQSKMSGSVIMESVKMPWKLRFSR